MLRQSGTLKPICLNHSWWLMKINGILPFYTSARRSRLGSLIKTLVTFIIHAYTSMWLAIKSPVIMQRWSQAYSPDNCQVMTPQPRVQEDREPRHSSRRVTCSPRECTPDHDHRPSTRHTRTGRAMIDEGCSKSLRLKNVKFKIPAKKLRCRRIFRYDWTG